MGSLFRQWKNRLHCLNKRTPHLSIENELRNVYNTLETLYDENYLLKTRIDKIEERHQRWIDEEQINLLKRIEKLENDNHQFLESYRAYQIQNENCIQTITDLIVKILSTQQDLRKQCIEQHNANDAAQWWRKQQHDVSITQNTRSASSHLSSDQLDDSRYTTNDQSTWLHQRLMIVEEQDQKTTNYPLEINNHSSTLATVKSKSDKTSTSTNKLYFVLNNDKTPPSKSTRIDESSVPHRKQQSSTITFNKNRSTYSNHERSPTVNTNTTTPSISKPVRVPATTVRPSTTNIRQRPSTTNPKTVPSIPTTNKSIHPRHTIPKPPEPPRSIKTTTTTTRPRPGQTTTNNIKTRTPIVVHQSARATDLDTLMTEQQNKKSSNKPKIVSSPPKINHIKHALFSKNTVKVVRPVRSQELKLFSSHLTPDKPAQTNNSVSTLTPPSLELITDKKANKVTGKNDDYPYSSHNNSGVIRDFSADSLNEHHHLQKLLKQNVSINTSYVQDQVSDENIQTTIVSTHDNVRIKQENNEEGYFLLTDDNTNQSSSLIKPAVISSSEKSLVHRLVFPARLGRIVFHRRILSDSDIYQKNCSKDNEIHHNVYHLDTIRDYSMEFYMLTTYASDSQLRAWMDSNDDEIENNVCQFDENRFLQNYNDDDDETTNDEKKKMNSSDSLIRSQEELDWNSELDLLDLSSHNQQEKQASSGSSEVHVEELLRAEQFSVTMTTSIDSFTSTDLSSASWSTPNDTSTQVHPNVPPSNITDQTNSILREILTHPWTIHSSPSNNIEQEVDINQYENDSTSSIITDGFQTDFYYLCPITNTISFSKTDYKPLCHDV